MKEATVFLRCPIRECDELVKSFCKHDSSYTNYDLQLVPQDNVLRPEEIRLSHKMGARFSNSLIENLLNRGNSITKALSQISLGLSILDSFEKIPWDVLEELFKTCVMPGLGEANITKILHKKRPQLIPILDSVVQGYLGGLPVTHSNVPQAPEKKIVFHIRQLKQDADANRLTLLNLAEQFDLSVVRILDILIWTHFAKPRWRIIRGVSGKETAVVRQVEQPATGPKLSIPCMALQSAKNHFANRPFSRQSLYRAMMEDYGCVKPGSFLPADWTVNEISGYEFTPEDGQWHKRYQVLFKREDGLFELYDPSLHGAWTRVDNKCRRTK